MVIVRSTKCTHEGCKTQPHYNYENERNVLFCSVHKENGMLNVNSKWRTDTTNKIKKIRNEVPNC